MMLNPLIQTSIAPATEFSLWLRIKDANPGARELYHRHYSRRVYRDLRDPKKFIGPGEYICLVLPGFKGLFVWRRFISMDNQAGVNCAIFRNESEILSSSLILEAEKWIDPKWPLENRLYTYVNSKKIKGTNPGYCFLMAGWRKSGKTKSGLVILHKLREWGFGVVKQRPYKNA